MPEIPAGFREIRCGMLDKEHRIFVAGSKSAERLVFFQAGYPDDQTAFVSLALRMAGENSFVALSCMPEFDCDGSKQLQRLGGYSFDEAALCFGQAVNALREEADSPDTPLTLVIHDWAVAPGIIWTNRCIKEGTGVPAKLVLFDVLPSTFSKPANSARELFIHLLYRALFAFSFLLSRLSGMLATVWCGLGMALIFGVLGRWLNPTGSLDGKKGKGASRGGDFAALPRMAYPYWHMFNEIAMGGALTKECRMPPIGKSLPMLYMFGINKNTMFHTDEDLAAIDAAEGCEQIGVQDAAHWLYLQQPDLCWKHLKRFVCQ